MTSPNRLADHAPATSATRAATRSCTEFDRLQLSRRGFLGATLAGAGVASVGTLFADSYRQVAYGAERGNNVVVVLSLRGGADGLSLVVPRAAADREVLDRLRPGIGVPAASLVGGDAAFGLHPKLEPLVPMWNDGAFGAVHAVGPAVSKRSHFACIELIEDADPGSSDRVGWINRMVGLDTQALPESSVQLGSRLIPTSQFGPVPTLGAKGVSDLSIIPHAGGHRARRNSLRRMWSAEEDLLGRSVRSTLALADRMAPLVDSVGADNSPIQRSAYPPGPLQDVLANTAALIRADLGTKVVTVDYGDWDMHVALGYGDRNPTRGVLAGMVDHFARSMVAFFDDLGTDASRVTVVTISEFGRRLAENGVHGLDHGYGNVMMTLGAGVRGGEVRGAWPGLTDLENGDLRVTRDYRSVLWEVMTSRFPEISARRSTVFPDFTPETIGTML